METHGTGTPLGDPVEIQALTEAFREFTSRRGFCAIGSVKTNIGHATLAAGVASLIKVLMALRHGQIPPSLGFEHANPRIPLDESPFFVNTSLREWAAPAGVPRRAAISGFGFNGSNCHMLIEEAPERPRQVWTSQGPELIPLSARTPAALRRRIADLAEWIGTQSPAPALADIAHTLQLGRQHFETRAAVVVSSVEELRRALQELTDRPVPAAAGKEEAERLVLQIRDGGLNSEAAREALLTLASLFRQGCDVPWRDLRSAAAGRRISLPTYPFANDRYWVEQSEITQGEWETVQPVAKDHLVLGKPVLPGAGYLEMSASALGVPFRLTNFSVAAAPAVRIGRPGCADRCARKPYRNMERRCASCRRRREPAARSW